MVVHGAAAGSRTAGAAGPSRICTNRRDDPSLRRDAIEWIIGGFQTTWGFDGLQV